MKITVMEKNKTPHECEVLFTFPVMRMNWECDSEGWVVRHSGKKRLVLTSHGRAYFAKESDLHTLLTEYQNTARQTREALHMVQFDK